MNGSGTDGVRCMMHHSLKLIASVTSGIGCTGLRADSEQALKRRVAEIERHGLGVGWRDGDLGSRKDRTYAG